MTTDLFERLRQQLDAPTLDCTSCGETKPCHEFSRDRSRARGYTYWCRRCRRRRRKAGDRTNRVGCLLPVDPLRKAFEVTIRDLGLEHATRTGRPTRECVVIKEAELFGVSDHCVWLWRTGRQTSVQLATAERICDQVGVHPAEIWGDTYIGAFA